MIYIFLILFCIFIAVFFICYISGYAKGKKQTEIKRIEESLQKAEETILYNQQKEEIKQEVFKDAETRKAELNAVGSDTDTDNSGRDRFDHINAVLRGKPENRIEYVYEKPDIPAFPVFPDPYPVTYDEAADTVSMPLWYWQKIAEYKIDVDAIEAYTAKIKQLEPKKEK